MTGVSASRSRERPADSEASIGAVRPLRSPTRENRTIIASPGVIFTLGLGTKSAFNRRPPGLISFYQVKKVNGLFSKGLYYLRAYFTRDKLYLLKKQAGAGCIRSKFNSSNIPTCTLSPLNRDRKNITKNRSKAVTKLLETKRNCRTCTQRLTGREENVFRFILKYTLDRMFFLATCFGLGAVMRKELKCRCRSEIDLYGSIVLDF